MSFTLAHLSDVHLGDLPELRWRHWGLKRGLGYLNWHRNRKHVHLRSTLALLLADLAAQAHDHVTVTGDLVNIGLPSEYERARDWLTALGPPDRVTVVPGNHDVYVRLRSDPGVARWSSYMRPSATEPGQNGPDAPLTFPFLRRFGRVALIGLNSAVPTPPLIAAGNLGRPQRQALGTLLDTLADQGMIRVVLIHHPPLPGQASRVKALRDATELSELLARHGAELVLHGHNHRFAVREHPTVGGAAIPVIGVPSASVGHIHKNETLARYHLFRFAWDGKAPAIEMIARGLAAPDGPVVEIERRRISGV